MSENKDRLNFRMKPETAEKLEHWYKADHCRSKNEFVEKAVNFYADALAAENSTTLPMAIQTAIDGRLKLLEDRMASILYKQTVEMDMAISILLQSVNVDESVLRQERAKSIAAVKHTNLWDKSSHRLLCFCTIIVKPSRAAEAEGVPIALLYFRCLPLCRCSIWSKDFVYPQNHSNGRVCEIKDYHLSMSADQFSAASQALFILF